MVDEGGNPWFIESNMWPDLHIFSKSKWQTVNPLISDMVDLTMEFHENWNNMN